MTYRAALGLGGNVGDPPEAMGNALRQLDQHCGCKITAVSRLYKTPPWGKTDQAAFFNCCALIETELGPEDLLELCLGIERNMKRVRIERWGPRTIDIDVLVYDDIEVRTERLQLPHPHMTERAFVLMPLNDVASTLQVAGRTVADWLALSDRTDIRVACEDTGWWRQA